MISNSKVPRSHPPTPQRFVPSRRTKKFPHSLRHRQQKEMPQEAKETSKSSDPVSGPRVRMKWNKKQEAIEKTRVKLGYFWRIETSVERSRRTLFSLPKKTDRLTPPRPPCLRRTFSGTASPAIRRAPENV